MSHFLIENLGTCFSIFQDFRNWASFSLHFLIKQLMLQPFITNGVITIIKIKTTVCVETPCMFTYVWNQKIFLGKGGKILWLEILNGGGKSFYPDITEWSLMQM